MSTSASTSFARVDLSRRTFLAGAAATAAALALGARTRSAFADAEPAKETAGADPADTADAQVAPYGENTEGAVAGGILKWYVANPGAIEPFGAEENHGIQIASNLFDTLTRYDYANNRVVPQACSNYVQRDSALHCELMPLSFQMIRIKAR